MATILDLYKNSDFAKLADKSKDKTPLSEDKSFKANVDEAKLAKSRGGKLKDTKYSTTIKP
jgi:hypothetical protein